MQADFVDIWNEVLELGREAEHLAAAVLRHRSSDRDLQSIWEATQLLGSGTEKVYTGCERVMGMIAVRVDRMPVVSNEGWHATLLLRMARPFPDVRPAILEEDTYRRLDKLRSFRHRERNSYGMHLDPGIVREREKDAVEAFATFKSDIARFIGEPLHGASS